jgi:hypothetical protein
VKREESALQSDPSQGIPLKKIPKNVHTVFTFKLPFAIPLPDGLYEIVLGGKKADIVIKRIQRTDILGVASSGSVQLMFDKYGWSSFSEVSMTFRWKLDLEEIGRTPIVLGGVPLPPRHKAKETVVRFLNRFIDVVRYTTSEFWVEKVRYQDLLSYQVYYWDGKNKISGRFAFIDNGVGGVMMCRGNPFQVHSQKLDKINDLLEHETPLDSSSTLILNAKDSCLQESFRLAIIEAVAGLEVVLYNFITVQGKKLGLPDKGLKDFIIDVGLTGNINIVLKMLASGLEQIDAATLRECTGAIKIRNKILHEGLLDVGSTDTEKRVLAIEKMISYLRKITP